MSTITPSERAEIAGRVGINEQYLYQCMTGRRQMKPRLALIVERESANRITRAVLRQKDWDEVWPDFVVPADAEVKAA